MTDLSLGVAPPATGTPATWSVLHPPAADRLAERFEGRHPATAALGTLVLCYLVIASVTAVVGLVIVHVVVADGRARWDLVGVNQWFVDRFTPAVDTWSGWGSRMAETLTVVAIVAVVSVGFLLARHWQQALFLVSALTLEVSVFLTMTLLVERDRPPVPKPDEVPPTSSYPSGHTAAGTALYLALAVCIAAHIRNRAARVLVLVAGLLPGIAVGMSRIARGMHHPTDVMVGFLLGITCVLAALFVVAVTEVVAARRAERAEVAS